MNGLGLKKNGKSYKRSWKWKYDPDKETAGDMGWLLNPWGVSIVYETKETCDILIQAIEGKGEYHGK